jgi:hypothetical protein
LIFNSQNFYAHSHWRLIEDQEEFAYLSHPAHIERQSAQLIFMKFPSKLNMNLYRTLGTLDDIYIIELKA